MQMLTAAMKSKDTCSLKKSYDQPRQNIKKQRHYVPDKGPSSQSYGFSSSHEQMWELDNKESWALKNSCFRTVVWGLLRVPWTARRSNQPILKEVSPEHSWERPKAGGEADNRGRDGWMASLARWTWVWASLRWWWTGKPGGLPSTGSQRVSDNWVTELMELHT